MSVAHAPASDRLFALDWALRAGGSFWLWVQPFSEPSAAWRRIVVAGVFCAGKCPYVLVGENIWMWAFHRQFAVINTRTLELSQPLAPLPTRSQPVLAAFGSVLVMLAGADPVTAVPRTDAVWVDTDTLATQTVQVRPNLPSLAFMPVRQCGRSPAQASVGKAA